MSATPIEHVKPEPTNKPGQPYKLKQNIPVGISSLQLRGPINPSFYDCDVTASLRVLPLTPAIKLGNLKGNLQDGVTTNGGFAWMKGSVTLFRKEDKLWIRANFVLRKSTHTFEFGIMPLSKSEEAARSNEMEETAPSQTPEEAALNKKSEEKVTA
ncbi:hypothetical protein EIP91_000442 [Steccherinum ochraceum]|uniref:Uncharacterized protein n=1 Tax=Steccherinum ochraceum TaxID=92696 RepID=A0A4V2MWQ2_9APHY|nr:hypothetical protein EIP91_000442 [Steccherinum ochraceum]